MKHEFVEYPGFSKHTKTKKITDSQLKQLQLDIMKGGGQTIRGTGGFKKIRCGGDAIGKRGGWRVIFAEYPEYNRVILFEAFDNKTKTKINAKLANLLKTVKQELNQHMRIQYGHEKGSEKNRK